jgi:hypothetical protein
MSVRDNFWPMATGPRPELHFQGFLNSGLTVVMMCCVVVILTAAARRCFLVQRGVIATASAEAS